MKKVFLLLSVILIISCQSKEVEKSTENVKEIQPKKVFPKLEKDRYNVAFLIMDGTFNTELTAPFDIFQHTIFRENIKAMNVFTVANTDKPITTFEGMRILPDFNYLKDSLPKIDILVIPSAEHHLDSDLEDAAMIDFVKRVDKDATYITSHCDGAFVLAKAGLLNDRVSTTFPSDIDKYNAASKDFAPPAEVMYFPSCTNKTSFLISKPGKVALILSISEGKVVETLSFNNPAFAKTKAPSQ